MLVCYIPALVVTLASFAVPRLADAQTSSAWPKN
jgi:hypothetical protein